jgi:hypothetical protein
MKPHRIAGMRIELVGGTRADDENDEKTGRKDRKSAQGQGRGHRERERER